jgi:hypothetical protein
MRPEVTRGGTKGAIGSEMLRKMGGDLGNRVAVQMHVAHSEEFGAEALDLGSAQRAIDRVALLFLEGKEDGCEIAIRGIKEP